MIRAVTLADIALAVASARKGAASDDDWALIEWACGLAPTHQADRQQLSFDFLMRNQNGIDRKKIRFEF